MCGNESAVELVQRLASLMNEPLEVSAARFSTCNHRNPSLSLSLEITSTNQS